MRSRRQIIEKGKINQKGFTLIEMISVLAILSLTSFIAIGSVQSFRTYELVKFADQLEQMIQRTQQSAATRNKSYEIYCQYREDKNRVVANREGFIEESLEIPEGISILIGTKANYIEGEFVVQSATGKIKFSKDMSPAQGGTITIQKQGIKGVIQITIRPVTGKVTQYNKLI